MSVSSNFTGSIFEPYDFIKKICNDNPYRICVITWINCCSGDSNINEAKFYHERDTDKILKDIGEELEFMVRLDVIYEGNRIYTGSIDRAITSLEIINGTDILMSKIPGLIEKIEEQEGW